MPATHALSHLQDRDHMNRRTRKLVGTVGMLIFVFLYALVVTAIAAPILLTASKTVQAIFYAVAGLAWAPPLMVVIKWMEGGRDDTRPTGPV
jgi:Zn-dependent protease with chaperone function